MLCYRATTYDIRWVLWAGVRWGDKRNDLQLARMLACLPVCLASLPHMHARTLGQSVGIDGRMGNVGSLKLEVGSWQSDSKQIVRFADSNLGSLHKTKLILIIHITSHHIITSKSLHFLRQITRKGNPSADSETHLFASLTTLHPRRPPPAANHGDYGDSPRL
jgi:hypothetical protein